MPCDSRVTRTNMTDAGRLAEALGAEGWQIDQFGELFVNATREGRWLSFARARAGQAFTTGSAIGRDEQNAIQRKYSEIGIRAWAKKNRFAVAWTENEGRKLVLINRTGG